MLITISRIVKDSFSLGSIRIDNDVVEKEIHNEQIRDAIRILGTSGDKRRSNQFSLMNAPLIMCVQRIPKKTSAPRFANKVQSIFSGLSA
jgi:hypothetical protein